MLKEKRETGIGGRAFPGDYNWDCNNGHTARSFEIFCYSCLHEALDDCENKKRWVVGDRRMKWYLVDSKDRDFQDFSLSTEDCEQMNWDFDCAPRISFRKDNKGGN